LVLGPTQNGRVAKNVCKLQKGPKRAEREMFIVRDVRGFISKIAGSRLYALAVVAVTTGNLRPSVQARRRQGRCGRQRGLETLDDSVAIRWQVSAFVLPPAPLNH
jgi:hypothetical protein